MPFTFSHPAIVLPLGYLQKGRVSLTGLVMGSIVPDFEKFIKMKPDNTFSHTWPAILWFNLPLALVLSWVFHNIVRKDMIRNLPGPFYKRFYRFANVNWNRYFIRHYRVVIFSVIIGTGSHFVWDGFTQDDGIVANGLATLLSSEHQPVSTYSSGLVLFIANSVAGCLGILYTIRKLPVTDAPVRQNREIAKYWVHTAMVFFFIIVCRLLTGLSLTQYWELLYTSISACLISLIVAPLLMNAVNAMNERGYKRLAE